RTLGKDKKKLVKTITLPQLECVGLPVRRLELYRDRERWKIAREKAIAAGYSDPDGHPVVAGAASYLDELFGRCALSFAADDGLRKNQYLRGRPGIHYVFDLARGQAGRPVGIRGVKPNWSADTKRDPAYIKNGKAHPD